MQAPHCPQLLQVWYEHPPHEPGCVLPGEQTAGVGHEQAPHAQLAVQLWLPYVLHVRDEKGEQVAPEGHEHEPQAQLEEQTSLPYVLHACDEFGEHTPCPLQLPVCHVPPEHVSVSVPQFPQATVIIWPFVHMPWHVPLTHVWPEHGDMTFQVPLVLQTSGALLPVHPVAPGEHTPVHWPPAHAWFVQSVGLP